MVIFPILGLDARLLTKTCRRAIAGVISDEVLACAVDEMEQGLIGAARGGSLYKKRVGRPGRGKRGGYRTLIAWRREDRAVFLFAFAKNETENITRGALAALRLLADQYMRFTEDDLERAMASGELIEVPYGDETTT